MKEGEEFRKTMPEESGGLGGQSDKMAIGPTYPFSLQEYEMIKAGTGLEDKLLKKIFGSEHHFDSSPMSDEEMEELRQSELSSRRIAVTHYLDMPLEEVPLDDYQALDELYKRAEAVRLSELQRQIEDVMVSLTPRERRVLSLKNGLNDGKTRTIKEVASEINRSESTVRRIETKALKKLRHPSRLGDWLITQKPDLTE